MMKLPVFAILALIVRVRVLGAAPKLEESLLKSLQGGQTANLLITMRNSTSTLLIGFNERTYPTRADRATTLVQELSELARTSQARIIQILEQEQTRTDAGLSYRSLWITNQVAIRGASQELAEKLATFPEVHSVAVQGEVKFQIPAQKSYFTSSGDGGKTPSWSIARIHAPEVWHREGINGSGIVLATISSGVRRSHEGLQSSFRPAYGWFDEYAGTRKPRDDRGEGTHLTGVLVGSDGIGVAPGGQWIACKPCGPSGSSCLIEDFIACCQWILCPTHYNGNNPDCSMAPDVVTVGIIPPEEDTDELEAITKLWSAVGIIPVFSVGNSEGQTCGSIQSVAAFEHVIGVGATNGYDRVAEFSSFGPSSPALGFKPDVVSPGVLVVSAGYTSDASYIPLSGTEVSAAHVAGTVALMLASRPLDQPCLQQVRDALRRSSERISGEGKECSGVSDYNHPNYQHGYGIVNALRAVRLYKDMNNSCP